MKPLRTRHRYVKVSTEETLFYHFLVYVHSHSVGVEMPLKVSVDLPTVITVPVLSFLLLLLSLSTVTATFVLYRVRLRKKPEDEEADRETNEDNLYSNISKMKGKVGRFGSSKPPAPPVKPKRAHASYEVPVYTKVPMYPNEAYCVPNARPNVPKMNHNAAYAVCQTTTKPSKKVFGGKGSVVNGQTNAGSKQLKSVKVYPNEAYAVPNGHSTTTTKGNKKSQQKRVFGMSKYPSGAPVVGEKVPKCVKVQVYPNEVYAVPNRVREDEVVYEIVI